jgi:hypothetical protein
VAGQPELSDEENIQRGVKCARDLVRDRAPPRGSEDHDIASAVKVFEVCREFNASLPPIFVQLFVTKFCGHESLLVLRAASRISPPHVYVS